MAGEQKTAFQPDSGNNFIPKYYFIKQNLLEDIESGKYMPGTKLPSNMELVKKYDTARGTVERAMIELIKEGKVYTIQGKGCFVAEGGTAVAKQLTPQESRRVVLVMPDDVSQVFYAVILKSIMDVVQAKGYSIELHTTSWDTVMRLWFAGILGADREDLPSVPEHTPGRDAYRSLSHFSASPIVSRSASLPHLSGGT